MLWRTVAALTLGVALAAPAIAADVPAEIKIGTLYASSGRYASISMPVHDGLKLWVDQKNAEGGVYVKAFDKKIPIKLVAYDDQSNTATASTLYNQLITQDKVDILVADSGSVLTAPRGDDRPRPQDVPVRPDRHRRQLLLQGQSLHRADGRSGLDDLAEADRRLPDPRRSRRSASRRSPSSTRPTNSPAPRPRRCASSSRTSALRSRSSTTRAFRPKPRTTP